MKVEVESHIKNNNDEIYENSEVKILRKYKHLISLCGDEWKAFTRCSGSSH